MELSAQEPRMNIFRQFHNLNKASVRQSAADTQAFFHNLFSESVIKFITVTVTFVNQLCTVSFFGKRAG